MQLQQLSTVVILFTYAYLHTPHSPNFKAKILFSALKLSSFPCSSVAKESACNAGDLDSIPGSGRSSGEGHDNPLQYSCLEYPMDRGAWQATVHGIAKSRTRLSN